MSTNESSFTTPSKKWTLDQLGKYVADSIAKSASDEAAMLVLAKSSALSIFNAGKALSIARSKIKKGWTAWLKENGIARTPCYEAMELFARAASPTNLKDMSATTAKLHFGIIKAKPKLNVVPVQPVETPVPHHDLQPQPIENPNPVDVAEQVETPAPKAHSVWTSAPKPMPAKKPASDPVDPQPEITNEEQDAFEAFCSAIGSKARAYYVFTKLWEVAR